MSDQPTEGVAVPITELPAMAGDGWVNCAQGHGHWGRFGAAGLLPAHRAPDGEVYVLMHHRAAGTDQGETWSLLGGARDSHETAAEAAVREAIEESDLDAARLQVERVVRDDHGGWSYDTVIVSLDQRLPVRPVEGESLALAWVPLTEVPGLALHPGFAASWPRVQVELEAVLSGRPAAPGPLVAAAAAAAAAAVAGAGAREPARLLPAHPVTGAHAATAADLGLGAGATRRQLVTFDDGARAVFEEYVRTEDVVDKVLDAYVGRAVGARVPLAHPVGPTQVYVDDMPGEPASAHHRRLADLSHLAATRDGVFLGLYHAVTASQGLTVDKLVLGEQQGLITVNDGATSHGPLPDLGNPFVGTFFRQTQPQVFSWTDHPVSAGDVEVMRRHLDGLRPLFEHLGRAGFHDTVMERFGHVAQHATGTAPLLTRPPGFQVTLPVPDAGRRHDRLPPVGSQERADYQRIGEELLTDDGRIADTPQAKTIAIQALAERMRSTTPELVLAAMGLHVGNDMADHLGDGRYVLVPHNERYPSMGAAVMGVDELDPADPRHAADRVVPMDAPEADTLIRMIAVSELMGSWSYGSNNNVRVLALQEAAREEFGLTEVLEWRMDRPTASAVALELDYNRDALREFLRTQYEMTQEALAARGITEVLSYRALSWPAGAGQPSWADLDVGDTFEARQRPLASWSADRQIVADWLEQRGGSGVVLADRKPAADILSLPMTGMGYFAQKEWVTLPGDGLVTLDGVFDAGAPAPAVEQTAASSVALGTPALDDAVESPVEGALHGPVPAADVPRDRWSPLTITAELDPSNALDRRIAQILEGQQELPSWWPRDDSGYAITQRDLDFLGIKPVQVKWLLTGEAPMGMTPKLYQDFRTQMLEALERDGIEASKVDVRLKGTGAGFFSGIHKSLPQEEDLADRPEAAQRLREWFGDDEDRPVRRPYDGMWRMGLEPEPSDFDLDINSTEIVRAAREHWNAHHSDRYPGDFMGGHGYLSKRAVAGALPALTEWAATWEGTLGRPISLGVFESSGPFDATQLGRSLSSHFRATDWIIHRADAQPYATPDDAAQAAEVVTARFQAWIGGAMGQELAASRHPRVAAFRDAWRQLPSLDAEPGPSVGPYGNVAECAKALITVASGTARFTPGDLDALQSLAKAAETHSVRLAATQPSAFPAGRGTPETASAPPPRVATPQPTAPRSPRLST
ncbi:NUDIX domain-containing protein [Streptomyces sp. NPDC046685]|uniref:NUDIX domain-containing protein n=1 Tax=Streptomyces sp. NPDC046685 TaxID=3157202 RepID=UPI0033C5D17B